MSAELGFKMKPVRSLFPFKHIEVHALKIISFLGLVFPELEERKWIPSSVEMSLSTQNSLAPEDLDKFIIIAKYVFRGTSIFQPFFLICLSYLLL